MRKARIGEWERKKERKMRVGEGEGKERALLLLLGLILLHCLAFSGDRHCVWC